MNASSNFIAAQAENSPRAGVKPYKLFALVAVAGLALGLTDSLTPWLGGLALAGGGVSLILAMIFRLLGDVK